MYEFRKRRIDCEEAEYKGKEDTMQNRIDKLKIGMRYVKRSMLLVLCLFLCSFAACKKEKTPGEGENVQTSPALENAWEGFSEANQALVKQRAEEYATTTAVSVGDMQVSMQKAMFLIYSMEAQGNSYAAYYESQYGIDYWEMAYDEAGRTTRDVFKDETMAALIQYAVLYDCAVKNGMTLDAAEIAETNTFVDDLTTLLSAEETERGGFTVENLRATAEWMMLGEKYYNRMTENLGVTKESVRETINPANYKEYETEYLYLPTTYYDEEYTIQNESEDIIESRKAQMQDYYEQVVAGASFDSLAASDDVLVHKTRTFLAEGDGAEELYKSTAMSLEVGEVCAPIQTEYGVYLIRMLDDECTKTYEATVDAEYELRRNEAFQAAYEVLLAEYEVKVNEDAWGEIMLGATVSISE